MRLLLTAATALASALVFLMLSAATSIPPTESCDEFGNAVLVYRDGRVKPNADPKKACRVK